MSVFTLANYFQFSLIHGPNIPGSYATLFFTALDFTFTTRYLHTWVLFLLWLSLLILSGAMSPLFSSSILASTNLGSSSFSVMCFSFHTAHGVFKARMLKWFAIPFPTGCFVRTFHHDPSVFAGSIWHGS